MSDELIDLGDHHLARIIYDNGIPVGLVESHKNPDGEPCGGTIWFEKSQWYLLDLEPLDVRPSINCDYCPSHGVIHRGKWQEAHNVPLQNGMQSSPDSSEPMQVSGS